MKALSNFLKYHLKVQLLIVSVIFSVAHAGTISSKIIRISTATPQFTNVSLVGSMLDLSGHPCATNLTHLSWDKSTQHGQQMFTLAMAGLLAGKELHFSYSDTSCGLWGNQAIVTRVDLKY